MVRPTIDPDIGERKREKGDGNSKRGKPQEKQIKASRRKWRS